MGYEPLHHKYRPQTFAQLVGQGAIATTLSSALNQRRIAPAYLFCGPRGTGKTSSARILAKSLNCISGDNPTAQPCGQCESCKSITAGSALDVIEIDAASNTGVDNIRELIERSQFAPVQCRYKVYVVDECHMLSTAAFNALLKTLEEPPDRVVFVLATTDPQRVLPTIISRCQRFDFRRIALPDMIEHLGAIARQESIDIADEALQLVAQVAQGGLRDAESLLDQLSLTDGQIGIDHVWDLVGAVPERDLLALVKAIATDDGIAVLDNARHLMDRGREPLIVLQNLAGFYRDLLIAKTAGDRQDLVAITPPTWAELCAFAQTIDLSFILQGQKRLRESEVQVKNTTQPRLWLEITLMGLLPSSLLPSQPTAPLPQPPTRAQPTPIPAPQTSPAPTPVPVVATPAPPPPTPSPPTPPVPPPPPTPTPITTSIPTPSPTHPPTHPPTLSPTHTPIPQPSNAYTSDQCDRLWQQVTTLVEPPIARTLFQQQGRLVEFDGAIAQVTIKSKQLMRLAEPRTEKLAIAFEQVLQHPVRVTMSVASSAAPAAPPAAPVSSPALSSTPASPPPTAMQPPPPAIPAPIPSAATPPVVPPPSSPPPSEPSNPPPLAPPNPPTPPPYIPEDALTQSINRFASMFNGEIVDLDDNDLDLLPPMGDRPQNDTQEPINQDSPPSPPPPANGPSHDPDVPF